MSSRRFFAIVPAAGRSLRMGEPKLLLPWNGHTIMESVLEAWCESHVTHTIVVLRNDDEALASICKKWPVEIIRPNAAPRDMKESIQFGLRHISEMHAPVDEDRWLVAPADIPTLNARVINRLVSASTKRSGVVAARYGNGQGHPVLLPWSLAADVFALRENEGLDTVVAAQQTCYVDFAAEQRLMDVDTREEYDRMKEA